MKTFINAITLGVSVVFTIATSTAIADERIDHFEGLPAETLDQALDNFSEYNDRLAGTLGHGELSAGDLSRIHQITYTLENALARIRLELDELADTLEALHLASEHGEVEGAKRHGANYLETARKLAP